MHLPRSGVTDTEAARRRLEAIVSGLGTAAPAPAVQRPDDERPPGDGLSSGRHLAPGLSRRGSLVARLLDAVPPTLRGRWGITAHHVTVLALLVGSALAVASWWVVRAQPEPLDAVPVTAPQDLSPAAPATPASTGEPPLEPGPGASPGADEPAGLVVHVAGKVRRPGIVELPSGSRVIDALQEAGGPRRNVDLSSLNLARPLADGEQILVGAGPRPAAAGPAGATGPDPSVDGPGPVNLNTATSDQLDELPGVGPVTAAAILDWRSEHGRFSSVEELLEVSGIGDATLADLRDHVTV